MKSKCFGNIHIIGGISLAVLLAQAASAQTRFTNEVWISTVPQTNFANGIYGSGTLDCPYDGSTQTKFDGVMHYLSDDPSPFHHTTIHLLAGSYQTLGYPGTWAAGLSWRLLDGQKLLGGGIDNTIIQLATNAPTGSYVVGSYPINAANIEVADLTLDANYSATSGAVSYGGLLLDGTSLVARRVKVINVAWADPSHEVMGITFCCGGTNSEGNVIEECEVYSAAGAPGPGCDGLAFNTGEPLWISGAMRNNRIVTPGIATGGSCMRNVIIEGNYIQGATAGVYSDAGSMTNILVAHNVFENCGYGSTIIGFPGQNILFANNTFTYTIPNFNAGVIRFLFAPYANVGVIGNTVTYNGNPRGSTEFLTMENISGLVVAGNTVEPNLYSTFTNCTGLSMYFNYDLNGNPRTDLDTMGFSTMTSFGRSLLSSPSSSAALVSLGLPGNPAMILTNHQSNVTLNGSFVGNGVGLTNLDASRLAGGTVPDARLSANVVRYLVTNIAVNTNVIVISGAAAGIANGNWLWDGVSTWTNSGAGMYVYQSVWLVITNAAHPDPDNDFLAYNTVSPYPTQPTSGPWFDNYGEIIPTMLAVYGTSANYTLNLSSGTNLPLSALPTAVVTNNQSQPVTFNSAVTVAGTLNYSNMVAQLLAGTGITTSTLNTSTGRVVTVNASAQTNGFGNIVTHNVAEFAASTNALVWNSASITNATASNWSTLSVTPSNAVITVKGLTVAILQTNGVLNAYNGLSTTVSNTLPAARVNFTGVTGVSWTNTTPWNIAGYIQNLNGAVSIYYNRSIVLSNSTATVMLKPNSILSITNRFGAGNLNATLYWHPF